MHISGGRQKLQVPVIHNCSTEDVNNGVNDIDLQSHGVTPGEQNCERGVGHSQ